MKNPGWEGKNVPLTADFKDNLDLSLTLGPFTLSHVVTFNSPYFYDPDNLDTSSSLPLCNASISFAGVPMTKITFRVENYLDQHVEDFRDYPKPGRAYYFAILMDIKQSLNK
jgi:outer membrane cobalamin receptor